MRRKRREQSRRKIGIKGEVVAQFRNAQIFRPHVGAAQAKRRLSPVVDHERREHLGFGNITGLIVLDDLQLLQLPGAGVRMIHGAGCDIIGHDVVVRILLHNMHGYETVFPRLGLLNKPGAVIGPIPENLGELAGLLTTRIFQEFLVRIVRMRGERVIQSRAHGRREQTDQEKRCDEPRQTDTGGEHGDDFVRARHPAETKKQREQKRHGQQDDQDLRDLREIIFGNQRSRNALIQKGRDIIADIENEPDRDKARDAVEVGLQEMAQDVAIEQSHGEFGNLEFRFAI